MVPIASSAMVLYGTDPIMVKAALKSVMAANPRNPTIHMATAIQTLMKIKIMSARILNMPINSGLITVPPQ